MTTERATGLARAQQIVDKAIEERSIPEPAAMTAAAAHATAIATIEQARASRAGVLVQIIDHPAAYAALDPQHREALVAELREFVGTIPPREEPQQ